MNGWSVMFPITSFTASLGYDGLIDVFAVALDPDSQDGGTVWHARQAAASNAWSPWSDAGKPGVGAVGVRSTVDPNGHGHVLALAGRGALWFKERWPADQFSRWQPLGRPLPDWSIIRMCGVTRAADGRLDVIATANGQTTGRDIWRRSRTVPDQDWREWRSLKIEEDFFGDVVAATGGDGGLDIVVPVPVFPHIGLQEIDMSHRRRGPDGTWTDWTLLGRPSGGFSEDITPVLTANSGGRLELFAVSAQGAVWHRWQTADSSWSPHWSSLGHAHGTVTGIAAAADSEGRLELCATLADHTVARRRQGLPGQPWSEWANLGHSATSAVADPVLILDARDCLHLLLALPHGVGIVTLQQEAPSGPWTMGAALPGVPHH
jgi:hypothetical protein